MDPERLSHLPKVTHTQLICGGVEIWTQIILIPEHPVLSPPTIKEPACNHAGNMEAA